MVKFVPTQHQQELGVLNGHTKTNLTSVRTSVKNNNSKYETRQTDTSAHTRKSGIEKSPNTPPSERWPFDTLAKLQTCVDAVILIKLKLKN